MTPTESREVVLTLSRERLARATSRLERTARNAAERITHLKEEKRALEGRLKDLEKLFSQERQNFDQRASLIESMKSENEERAKTFTELECRIDDSERLFNEQLATISKLESELAGRTFQIKDQQALETAWQAELNEWKEKSSQLEDRISKLSSERDELRSKAYDNERQNAQYALRLTADEKESAAKALDALLDRVTLLESKAIAVSEK